MGRRFCESPQGQVLLVLVQKLPVHLLAWAACGCHIRGGLAGPLGRGGGLRPRRLTAVSAALFQHTFFSSCLHPGWKTAGQPLCPWKVLTEFCPCAFPLGLRSPSSLSGHMRFCVSTKTHYLLKLCCLSTFWKQVDPKLQVMNALKGGGEDKSEEKEERGRRKETEEKTDLLLEIGSLVWSTHCEPHKVASLVGRIFLQQFGQLL